MTYVVSAHAADDDVDPFDVDLAWDLAVEPDEGAAPPSVEAKDGKPARHTGCMVALLVPRAAAVRLADGVDGEDADELHVTLAYLGKAVDVDRALALQAVTAAAAEWAGGHLEASLTGVARFGANDGGVPEVYLVNAVGLAELRTLVVRHLDAMGVDVKRDYDFIPHVTRRYIAAGDEALEEPPPEAPDVTWVWTALTLAHGDTQTHVTLGSALEVKARVRTPEGAERFGQPIGSTIERDVVENVIEGLERLHAENVQRELETALDERDLPSARNPTDDEIRATFEGTHAGLTTEVSRIDRRPFGVRVDGVVLDDDGAVVGNFERSIDPAAAAVGHAKLRVDSDYRGRGFATSFNAQAEASYRALGYRRIFVTAGDEDGGRVWARAGYGWADDGMPYEVAGYLMEAVNVGELPPGESGLEVDFGWVRGWYDDVPALAKLGRLLEAGDGEEVTPARVAETELGAVILTTIGWRGVKDLEPETKTADEPDRMYLYVLGADDEPETKAATRRVRTAAGARRFGVSIGSIITLDAPETGDARLSPGFEAARVRAREKLKALPSVDPELVKKRTAEAELIAAGKLRNGGEHRGNSRDRARSRLNLFREFGGEQLGHVPCVHCGLPLHHEEDNELGLPKLVRDKLRVFRDGGGYQLFNLVPSCASCNASRGDKPIDLGPVRPPRPVRGAHPFGADGRFENDPDVDIEPSRAVVDGVLVERDVHGDRPHRQRLVNGVPVDDPGVEDKARFVRTPAGRDRFDLPIGAMIVPRPPLGSLAEALADFLNPPAGESEAARKLVPSVEELIVGGLDPAAAVKEHKRLHHNKTVALIRARQKLEKSGQKLVEADGKLPAPPKMPTEADPAVIADWALANQGAPLPKALYDRPYQGPSGPGGVSTYGHGNWAAAVKQDTTEPIPVVGLTIESHHVKRGIAERRKGVVYLAELDEGESAEAGVGRIAAAAAIYDSVLATVPEGSGVREMLHGVSLLRAPNPQDKHWAVKYNQPGFQSYATGGHGGVTTYWAGNEVRHTTAAHELGHIVDSEAGGGQDYASSSPKSVIGWDDAQVEDTYSAVAVGGLGFKLTRAGGYPPIFGPAVTDYGAKHVNEDFAESVRLYLKDRREGKLGYLSGMPASGVLDGSATTQRMDVRFADIWPARARVLDQLFGVESVYETPYRTAQRKRAEDELKLRIGNGSAIEADQINQVRFHYGLTASEFAELHAAASAAHQAEVRERNAITFSQAAKSRYKQKLDELYQDELVSAFGAAQTDLSEDDPDGFERLKALDSAVDRLRSFHLVDDLTHKEIHDFTDEDLANLDKLAEEVADAKRTELTKKLAVEAKLQAEQALAESAIEAAEFQASIADYKKLPAETAKKIRKKKAAVKFYAKKGGASPQEAQLAADEYELSALAEALQSEGLTGTPSKLVKTPSAGAVMVPRIKAGANKRAVQFRNVRMDKLHPLSPHQPSYGSTQRSKDRVATEIAERLNNESDWEIFRTYMASASRPGSGHSANFELLEPVELKPFDDYTAEERRRLLYDDVNTRVATWASTSGDSHVTALGMQHAAKDEFNLTADWGARFLSQSHHNQTEIDKLRDAVAQTYPTVGPWYRRILRHMWTHTQEEFAKDGITEIGLHRGMNNMPWAKGKPVRPLLQPLNSWSSSAPIAKRFGTKQIKATIPVSRIVGSSVTGFGCLNEYEYVVLDTDGEAMVTSKYAW